MIQIETESPHDVLNPAFPRYLMGEQLNPLGTFLLGPDDERHRGKKLNHSVDKASFGNDQPPLEAIPEYSFPERWLPLPACGNHTHRSQCRSFTWAERILPVSAYAITLQDFHTNRLIKFLEASVTLEATTQ